jgi:ribosome-associated protein
MNEKENSKKMTQLILSALEEKKAQDITVIDIEKVSVIADYFVIAGGTSVPQIQTLSDYVEEVLGKSGYELKQKEGYSTGNWVLLDFGDVIVHIFDKENRLLYDLERVWMEGVVVTDSFLQ